MKKNDSTHSHFELRTHVCSRLQLKADRHRFNLGRLLKYTSELDQDGGTEEGFKLDSREGSLWFRRFDGKY